jgi:hypothetical protein
MQCSCCHAESENLREYSLSAVDENDRKTIRTFFLCAICRIIYLIKPAHVSQRIPTPSLRLAPRRVA